MIGLDQFDSASVSRKSAWKTLTKRILAGYSGVTDDELLEIAYNVYILKIRSKVSYPFAKGCKTLIDFTARDNPKVRDTHLRNIQQLASILLLHPNPVFF